MSNVPKLRFKEFSGDWESKKLGNVAQIVGGGTPSTTESEYWNGNIPWFTPTEIKSQKFVGMSGRAITEEGLKKSSAKILPKGTVLLTTRASLGDMAISNREVTTNQGFQSIIAGNDIINEFIYYLQPKLKKYCYKNASGSTFLEISKSNIEQFKFDMPSKEEQEKIASFFSLIDDKILLQGEKVEALKDYKTGMMQKIFSRELRFKDDCGMDYPEWETYLLGKSIILYDNLRKPVKEQERSSGKYAYYGATGIIDYINDYIFEGEYLLLGEDGANIVTRNAPLIYKTNGKFWVNNHAHIFKPTSEFDIDFMKQCLERINYVPYNTGTAQPKLNVESIKSIPFKAPTLDEQKKIAKLLINIDLQVEKQQEKLDFLNEYKKGLLQHMFV